MEPASQQQGGQLAAVISELQRLAQERQQETQALLQQIVEYCMEHGLPARTLTTPEPR